MDDLRSGSTGPSRRSTAIGIAGLLVGLRWGPTLAFGSGAASDRAARTGAAPGQLEQPAETWWNEDWARLVSLEGSWSVESRADRVILRPGGFNSRIDVLAMLTGRMHSYEFDARGEVVLAHGFLMIAERRPCSISQTPGVEAFREADLKWTSFNQANKSWVENVELHGTGAWALDHPSEFGRRFRLVHTRVEGAPTNSIVVNRSLGDSTEYVGSSDYPLLTLTLVRVQELGHPNAITGIHTASTALR